MRDYNSDDQLFLTDDYDKNDEYVFASMYDNPLLAANIESTYLDPTYIPPTEISSIGSPSTADNTIDLWDDDTIMNWVIDAYENVNKNYENCNLNKFHGITGSKLRHLDLKFFMNVDFEDGKWLYEKVQALLQHKSYATSYYTFQTESNIIKSREFESKDETEPIKIKRQRGRPKLSNKIRKKSEHRTGKLWEFIRDLLHNPKYCPALIMWEDHTNGIFRFVSSEKVAKLWGSMRGNDHMNYEKLSRAMRYYYKTEVFQPVLGKRLVYSFGSKARGWQTPNPNFENKNL